MFNNHSTAPGTSFTALYSLSGGPPSLVPFLFHTVDGGNLNAINGGPIANGLHVAFFYGNALHSIVYAFFDDGGAGPDADYDDMVVKIEAFNAALQAPIPSALVLFGSALLGLTVLGRRRRKSPAVPV